MEMNISQARVAFEKMGEKYPKAESVTFNKETIGKIVCYWFSNPVENPGDKMVIYVHGGCFVIGSVHSHAALVSHLANTLGLPFLFIEYSLAPEKPYPHAVNDLFSVYQYVLQNYPERRIILMGDSAGAALITSALTKIKENEIQLPDSLVMISPWVDLSCSNKSILENADLDPVLTKEKLQHYTSLYLARQDLVSANPLSHLLDEFPATLILTGSDEILLDDSKVLFDKISGSNSKTRLSIYEGQHHVWLLEDINTKASQQALQEMLKFINNPL